MAELYQRKRDFVICDVVGVCTTTREEFIKEAFTMPTEPVSATVNFIGVPAIVSAKEDPKLAQIYNEATIAAIDGAPIVASAKRKGLQCERCSGPDIMGLVFEEGIRQGKTHYFYGGRDDDVLQKLREHLEQDYPGIQIVGMYAPPFRPLTEKEDQKICDEINACHPDFLWVGIGAPKQEIWMWNHREKIHGTVMLGVGAAFNFYAKTLEKAPEWMGGLGLEWLFRLIKEPRRLWKRYILGGIKYFCYKVKSKIKTK